jgi:hypothetical protein
MKMKLYGVGATLIVGLLWLGGCYPGTSKITEELDVVVTRYDEDENFQRFTTYFIEDTIIQLGDPESSDYIPLDITREDMDRIIGQVRTNMEAYSYTAIDDPITTVPDVAIFIEVIAERKTVIYTYPGYGWGWGGWWGGYPGWGPGWGGWYPPSVGGYTYPVGTVLVNYIDVNGIVREDGKTFVPTPWLGILNGLLYETSAGDARVTNAIDQMFDQSQYLRLTK